MPHLSCDKPPMRKMLLNWREQFGRPISSQVPLHECRVPNLRFSRPLRQRKGSALMGNKDGILRDPSWPLVLHLPHNVSPSTIGWLVVAVDVFSVNGESRLPSVRDGPIVKPRERRPLCADADPPAAVVCPLFAPLVVAPLAHGSPAGVDRVTGQSVLFSGSFSHLITPIWYTRCRL